MADLKQTLIPYDGRRPFVFVSYSHEDTVVYEVIKLLQDSKYRVWFDSGIHTGESWTDEIVRKLDTCSAFVVFLSPNSIESPFVQSEVATAFKNKSKRRSLKIIPIWITPTVDMGKTLTYYLSAFQIAFENNTKYLTAEELFAELDPAIPDSISDKIHYNEDRTILNDTEDNINDLFVNSPIVEVADGACKGRKLLKQVHISDSVVRLGNETFRGCGALGEITIPASVTRIGDSCFRDCTSLKKLEIKGNVEIGERAFENCAELVDIKLPDTLAEIYNGVFNSCKKLERIKLPKNLIAIGDNAFSSCYELKYIELPESVTRIDDQVFAGCSSLANIIIPENVSRIGKSVFKDCIALKTIRIPESVRKMDSGCFRGCTALEKIEVASFNRSFKSENGVMFNKNKSILICYPANLISKKPEEYWIPDSVCTIEDWAFADAKQLKKVLIPPSVERIGEGAFFRCENLEEVRIPYSVDTIQDTAFRGCTNLKRVFIYSETFKDLGWGIFYGCNDVTVYTNSKQVQDYCNKLKIKHERLPDTWVDPIKPEELDKKEEAE